MLKTCKSVFTSFLAVALVCVPTPSNSRAILPASVGAQGSDGFDRCRTNIYSIMGSTQLISPDGLKVSVPMKDEEAARARGYRYDIDTLKQQALEYAKNPKQQSEQQVLIAKLSDSELDGLYSSVAACTLQFRERLSRNDLVNYGIAMAEIASARQYREMSHLIVSSNEERVKQYNELVAKYNTLIARCAR